MTRTIFQYIVLALGFLFLITAFHGRVPLWKRLLIFSAPLVCIFCCAVNLGSAWYSSTPRWFEILSTVIYVLFWLVFTMFAHRSRIMSAICLFMSSVMLAAAVTGIAVRTLRWDILTLPAIVLTPFSTLPMYGVSHFTDWVGLELVSIVLSVLWLGYSLHLDKKQKKVANPPPGE